MELTCTGTLLHITHPLLLSRTGSASLLRQTLCPPSSPLYHLIASDIPTLTSSQSPLSRLTTLTQSLPTQHRRIQILQTQPHLPNSPLSKSPHITSTETSTPSRFTIRSFLRPSLLPSQRSTRLVCMTAHQQVSDDASGANSVRAREKTRMIKANKGRSCKYYKCHNLAILAHRSIYDQTARHTVNSEYETGRLYRTTSH